MKIGQKAVQSTIYASINTYASLGITIVSSIIMARLLVPEHFGVVALGNFFLSLFGRVREFGLDYALIHRQEDLTEAFKVHFTLQVGLALVNFLLVLLSVPFLSRYYSQEVMAVLIVLALATILKAASSTPRVYLEKELNFKLTTIVDIVALFLSVILGVASAVSGLGLWSLVILNVSGIVITFLGLTIFSGWKIALSFNRQIIKWYLSFGIFLFIGAITSFILFQYNDFILGTFLGTAVLGFYTKAFQFAQLPTGLVTAVVSKVALPTYSKLQSDREKLGVAFNLVLRNIFRASAPFSLILFILAEDFVAFFLGEKWLPMVPIFKLLLIFSMLRPIFDDTGAFLTAIGKPHLLSKYLSIQAVVLLVLTPLMVVLYQENGAAISLNLVMVLGILLSYYYANRHIRIDYRNIFLPTLAATALTYLTVLLVHQIFPLTDVSTIGRLIINGALVVGTYASLVYLLESKSLKEDIRLFTGILREKNAEN